MDGFLGFEDAYRLGSAYAIRFGSIDIEISFGSDENTKSYSDFCRRYECPLEISYGSDSNAYLTGAALDGRLLK